MELVLPESIAKELLEYMRSQLPYESVAFLLGSRENDRFKAEEIVKMSNAAHSSVEFAVDPQELYDVYRKGSEIVCIFHSHPGPAVPSELDAFYMKLNPVPWLIASSLTGEFRAYVLNKSPTEIKVRII
ncbi:MAG: M67 family metallopeptidase [Nitrososphaerota archaeon]|nr:M67 family metallopeptidase [Nitrososphaerota archaeon]MDG6930798.1 M67 family metallopeptidase [Nitrososphaerota archaeon]